MHRKAKKALEFSGVTIVLTFVMLGALVEITGT